MTLEWTKTVEGVIDGQLGNSTHPIVRIGTSLWYGGTQNISGGFDSLISLSTGDGSVISEIEVRSLLGISSGAGAFSRGEMAVDHNGYIWLDSQSNGYIAGRNPYIVVDVISNNIAGTYGTAAAGTYLTVVKAPDITNRLMWIVKNATTLEAISTETYTLSHSITSINLTTSSLVVDEEKDELWVYTDTGNTLNIYTSSTGAYVRTVTGTSTSGLAGRITIVPSKNLIVYCTSSVVQTFSTDTYLLVSSGAIVTASDSFWLQYYYTDTNEIWGYYFDDTDSTEKIAFYNLDTLAFASFIIPTGSSQTYSGVSGEGAIFWASMEASINDDLIHKFSIAATVGAITYPTTTYTTTSEVSFPNSYNRELILDLTLEAWSVYDFAHDGVPYVHDYVPIPAYYLTATTVNVTDSLGVVVTNAAGGNVTIDIQTSTTRTVDPRQENFKFLASSISGSNLKISLAEYRDYTFTDWVSFDSVGADFSSYLITGYNLAGDMARQKQVVYLQIFCKRTETIYTAVGADVVLARQSSCYVQSQWNWCEDNTQGKWGPNFQAYRFLKTQPTSPAAGDPFLYGDTVIVTKNKLRGRGKALSLNIHSETGKDMKLLGWNTLTTINGEPS